VISISQESLICVFYEYPHGKETHAGNSHRQDLVLEDFDGKEDDTNTNEMRSELFTFLMIV
jgi:hypothetical protein